MSNIIYDPEKRTVRYKHYLIKNFYCGWDMNEEAIILIKLRVNEITLQDAYTEMMVCQQNLLKKQ